MLELTYSISHPGYLFERLREHGYGENDLLFVDPTISFPDVVEKSSIPPEILKAVKRDLGLCLFGNILDKEKYWVVGEILKNLNGKPLLIYNKRKLIPFIETGFEESIDLEETQTYYAEYAKNTNPLEEVCIGIVNL